MEQYDAFSAVSSPIRRKMLDILRSGSRSAGVLVAAFPSLPQPAVSRHLKVLRKAGMVRVTKKAQQRIYSIEPMGLRELDAWISVYRAFWTDRLDALEAHTDEMVRTLGNKKKSDINDK